MQRTPCFRVRSFSQFIGCASLSSAFCCRCPCRCRALLLLPKVDSTTKVSEYDGETQGAIRKIMFDHRQKSLGLPTSDQLSADAVLERAKGLPGSPFLPGGLMFDGGGGCGGGFAPDGGVRDPPGPPSAP